MSTQLHAVPAAAGASREAPPVAPETLTEARKAVANMLSESDSFRALDPATREQIAGDTAAITAVLAEPAHAEAEAARTAEAMAGPLGPLGGQSQQGDGVFQAQAAQQGVQQAGALLAAVDFPTFCAKLVEGVFHAIVTSSIEQMKAYGELVANVSKSLNEFRDENVSENQGRDHLVDQFPDTFMIDVDTADDGTQQPRVRVRDGVDEDAAVRKINGSLPLDKPISSLDDDTAEQELVPAARTQIATGRQQLLATMVLMGINRIVITDGKIQAKVLYDFQARDNMHFQKSATQFDYDPTLKKVQTHGEFESQTQGGSSSGAWGTDKFQWKGADKYTKGATDYQSEPVLNLVSASQTTADASLQTKAQLAGVVDLNFKSDYLPLEKMADPTMIAAIQGHAQPKPAAAPGGQTPAQGQQPAATPPAGGQQPAPAQPATPPPGQTR
jgi:hypothetical protein